MSRSTESTPMPTSRSRSGTDPANSAISMAWAGPVGLSKSRIMRQLMSRSGTGIEDAGPNALPHRLDRHAEADDEAGREEHLPVADTGRRAVLQRLVGDAPEVVGGLEAGADDVVDREELVEAGELEELGRILDGQLHVVASGPARRWSRPGPTPPRGSAARPWAGGGGGRRWRASWRLPSRRGCGRRRRGRGRPASGGTRTRRGRPSGPAPPSGRAGAAADAATPGWARPG